jgi:hypothetical protein
MKKRAGNRADARSQVRGLVEKVRPKIQIDRAVGGAFHGFLIADQGRCGPSVAIAVGSRGHCSIYREHRVCLQAPESPVPALLVGASDGQ